MKRYSLKHTLPTFKAGDEFYLGPDGSLYLDRSQGDHPNHYKEGDIMAYRRQTLEHFPNILGDWFEEIEEPEGLWRPKDGEEYWYITSDGCTLKDCYSGSMLAGSRLVIGNYFKTKKEAKKAIEKLEAYETIRQDAKGFRPNWEDEEQVKWYGIYNYYEETLESARAISYRDVGQIYFASNKDVEASLENHRKEWLALFDVEEDE